MSSVGRTIERNKTWAAAVIERARGGPLGRGLCRGRKVMSTLPPTWSTTFQVEGRVPTGRPEQVEQREDREGGRK